MPADKNFSVFGISTMALHLGQLKADIINPFLVSTSFSEEKVNYASGQARTALSISPLARFFSYSDCVM